MDVMIILLWIFLNGFHSWFLINQLTFLLCIHASCWRKTFLRNILPLKKKPMCVLLKKDRNIQNHNHVAFGHDPSPTGQVGGGKELNGYLKNRRRRNWGTLRHHCTPVLLFWIVLTWQQPLPRKVTFCFYYPAFRLFLTSALKKWHCVA